MKHKLIHALIEKNAFASDTIITADYHTADLFGRPFCKTGDFRIKRILKSNDSCLFELALLQDVANSTVKTSLDNIKAIDGMDIARFADIYDLLPDGSKKKTGRKRGRKPKAQLST